MLFWRDFRDCFVFRRIKERVFRLQRRETDEGHSRRSHGMRRGAAAGARVRRIVRRFRGVPATAAIACTSVAVKSGQAILDLLDEEIVE